MGTFLSSDEFLRRNAWMGQFAGLNDSDVDEVWIYPAERAIEEAFGLDLNTDDQPRHWAAAMDDVVDGARIEAEFQADYARATELFIKNWAANPTGSAESMSGKHSAVYARSWITPPIRALMRRWERKRYVGRA